MDRILEQVFIAVLNMSLTASVVILAVCAIRIMLCRVPHIFSYILWAVVLLRLLCPFSFTTGFSLLGILQNQVSVQGQMEYIPANISYQMEPEITLPLPALEAQVNASLPAANPAESVNPLQIWLFIGSYLWLVGIMVVLGYGMVSYVQLKNRLRNAIHMKDNIYQDNSIEVPFVFGFLKPRIYLPANLEEEEKVYIIAHEQTHIRRGDPMFRFLAYLALGLHWFNPFVWFAFILSGRDMEMSCDEAVLGRMGNDIKKNYSASLLNLAAGKQVVRGVPLSFVEKDTKGRVENVLRYRKPAGIIMVAAIVVCVIVSVFLLANPPVDAEKSKEASSMYTDINMDGISSIPYLLEEHFSDDHTSVIDGQYQLFIRSVSRSDRGIDNYFMEDWEDEEELPFLAFSDECTFFVNTEMDTFKTEEISFNEFVNLTAAANTSYMEPALFLTFRDGLITDVVLKNRWYELGITYQSFQGSGDIHDIMETLKWEGIDSIESIPEYYTLTGTAEGDFGDDESTEIAEIYTDGENGIVLFKNASGKFLYLETANSVHAGWNNIYLGKADGTDFLLTVSIEDRDSFGQYSYQVFRLAPAGSSTTIRQIAGSSFDFGEQIIYDEQAFRGWCDNLTYYLENSQLLLSTQDGVLNTERVSDADKYNFETLKR